MSLRVSNISFDCDDVLRVASFWSAALGRPLDASSGERWASIGGTDGARAEPAWYFTKVPEEKQAKNRVHLDLTAPEHPSVIDELVRLGATVLDEHAILDGQHPWTVLQDPEGNEFCVSARPFTGFD